MKSEFGINPASLLSAYPSDLILTPDGKVLFAGKNWNNEVIIGKEIEEVLTLSKESIADLKQKLHSIVSLGENKMTFDRFELFRMDQYIYLKWPVVENVFESNDQYRQLFENNMAAVFRTTVKGEIIEINQAYANIFGFDSIDELKQHRTSEFYPDNESRNRYIELLREKKSLSNYVVKNRNRSGKDIYLLANVRINEIKGEEFIEGTLIDITYQRENEKTISKQNAELKKLSSILENISDSVYVVDEEGFVIYLNAEARMRLGIDPHEIGKLKITDISPYFQSKEQFIDHMNAVESEGVFVVESKHINQRTGQLLPIELSVRFERIGQDRYLISTGRDISQRLKDQSAIKERDKHINDLNSAINSSSLVSITDCQGTILDVNEKFCEISQYTREELIGSNHRIVSSQTHTKEFWKKFYSKIIEGETWMGEICNRKKDGSIYWVRTVIYPVLDESGKPSRFMSIRQEISGEKEAERIIQKHLNFQDLLVKIALKLINVRPDVLDDEINEALKDIGAFVGADRAYIFDYNTSDETSSNLYEWCAEGVEAQINNLQKIPLSDMPEWTAKHFKGQIMDIPNVQDLPDSLLKELLEVQDIQSLLALPMMDTQVCTGFIGFDSVKSVHPFNDNDKKILELFALMLVNINKRVESIRLIEQANEQILDANKTLETRIQEEMDKSSQLTQSMATLDKMAMIGELTSGLAHDLNTPLGAIKVGAESVRFTLENLFKKVLEGNSMEQVQYACSRAVESNINMFVGGLQSIKESKEIAQYLEENYGFGSEQNALVAQFIKARVTVDEPEVIERVMQSGDPSGFLELIYHIQAIRTFIDTIMEAGEKAGSVVKSLRFYLKEGTSQEQVEVDVKENILTVVNVFNHMIKENDIELLIDLQDQLVIQGFPNRLYQLWSNLLKNGIEAAGKNGRIEIRAYKSKEGIKVSVCNSGEAIPAEIRDKIWKKFFTTKTTEGTGLGLSIVKRVVEEHGAKIQLSSVLDCTEFTITFND